MVEKKRSVRVTVTGIMMIVVGLFLWNLFNGLLALSNKMFFTHGADYIPTYYFYYIMRIIHCTYLVLGTFILLRKDWARVLTMFITGLLGIIIPITYLFRTVTTWGYGQMLVLVFILIFYVSPALISIFLLTHPKVKEQFK